ncbi:MAG: hypothetical protein IJ268_06700 [Proteobacteria bacterium]|nr:hypothetical protein [Pseudomonadota bacterium]
MKRFLSLLCFALCFLPAVAFADPDININIAPPANWESVDADISENRIAVFVDNATENRIEIQSKEFPKDSYAKTFFDSLHDNLTQNNFQPKGELTDKKITLNNGKERPGKLASYTYDLTESPISVKTFMFHVKAVVYIVTIYYAPQNKESAEKVFDEYLKTLTEAK